MGYAGPGILPSNGFDGTIIFGSTTPAEPAKIAFKVQQNLIWVERNGTEARTAIPSNDYQGFRMSPDSTRAALTIKNAAGGTDIWVWNFDRKTLTQLTKTASSSFPIWSPDGKKIAYLCTVNGQNNIDFRLSDGTGDIEHLASSSDYLCPNSWSADGKSVIFVAINSADLNGNIAEVSTEAGHAQRPLLQEKYTETYPQISHDGRWMAYMSAESGQYEVYVRPFPDVNKGKWQISSGGGMFPLWSRDGGELFYRNADAVLAVAIGKALPFTADKPRVLFKGEYELFSSLREGFPWDLGPDGKRFLMIKWDIGSKPAVK
jgi:Tol biopolymer transport system component